jgi:hypothetical protein
MRFEGDRAVARRTVAWDPVGGVLTVGERSVALTCPEGDNECILRTYLHLVAEQRDVVLDRSVVLRRDDVVVLAELLDLDDVRLERQLASILRLSAPDARALRRELLRHRVTVAAVGVGLVAFPLGVAAAAAEPAQPAEPAARVTPSPDALDRTVDTPTTTQVTVEAPPVAVVVPPTTVAAATAPTPVDETEIGYSVTYERDPDFVAPEGVDIGDAMVLERELPPGG